jgi:hypothetical protein
MALLLASCGSQHSGVAVPPYKGALLTATDTSAQLMPEEQFWQITGDAHNTARGQYSRQLQALKDHLTTLPNDEIVRFFNTFSALMAASYNTNVWGAAYVINGGCSDDCFEYFRQYLIAQGRDRFYAFLHNPDNCSDWIKSESDENYEGFGYVPIEAYKIKNGSELPITYQPNYELKGNMFDESSVERIYPRLAKKFSGVFH